DALSRLAGDGGTRARPRDRRLPGQLRGDRRLAGRAQAAAAREDRGDPEWHRPRAAAALLARPARRPLGGGPAARPPAGRGGRALVTGGETGLPVPPRAPAAVAAAVGRVLRDPALARRLATAARQRVEGAFSIDVMARRTMDAYLRRLHATRAPAAVAAA